MTSTYLTDWHCAVLFHRCPVCMDELVFDSYLYHNGKRIGEQFAHVPLSLTSSLKEAPFGRYYILYSDPFRLWEGLWGGML